jgi:hypothetical protein
MVAVAVTVIRSFTCGAHLWAIACVRLSLQGTAAVAAASTATRAGGTGRQLFSVGMGFVHAL